MVHELKIAPKWFNEKLKGLKQWEIRLNDRDFKTGDSLILLEYENGDYTGKSMIQLVDTIYDLPYLKEGYVIMTGRIILEEGGIIETTKYLINKKKWNNENG